MVNRNQPKVSILVLTYNHEMYIEEALQSVLRQQTSIPYEIVVAEDCSTDRTLEKVQAVARRNPGLFRIFHREENMGISRNFSDAYAQCLGEYIAILEGDDFWHHAHRLQRHVDILDNDNKCSFVFSDVRVMFENGQVKEGLYPSYVKSKLRLRDFLADNFINCSSLTFRHRLIPTFPKWFLSLQFYDWPLHILHLQHGHALYLREILSTYRIHSSSAWGGCDQHRRLRGMIEIFNCIDEHFGHRYESILRLNKNYRTALVEWEQARDENVKLKEALNRFRVENDKLKEALDYEVRSQATFRSSKSYKLARLLSKLKNGMFGVGLSRVE
jgi:glycosyltransferase involved in cell wall biosynthesis